VWLFFMIGKPLSRRHPLRIRLRLFQISLVLIVLLGVVDVVLLGIRALDRPGIPVAGELLYADGFQYEGFGRLWHTYPGQDSAEIANGALLITINASGEGSFSDLDRNFSDLDLQVDARWVSSESDADQVVVLFRYQDPVNYYAYKLRSDGAYRVERVKDKEVDVISQWQITPLMSTAVGASNQMRVVAKNDTFTFYLNGQQLPLCLKGSDKQSTWTGPRTGKCLSDGGQTRSSASDSTYRYGKIALGAVADAAGLRITFDNVLILGPKA